MCIRDRYPYSEEEKWSNNIKINKVLLQLKGKDKGPVHINIETLFSSDFSVKTLPEERAIMKFYNNDKLPNIKAQKVCIFVGSHSKFTMELQNAIDEFCEKYNAVSYTHLDVYKRQELRLPCKDLDILQQTVLW